MAGCSRRGRLCAPSRYRRSRGCSGAAAGRAGGGTDHEAEQRGPEQREPRAGIDRPGGGQHTDDLDLRRCDDPKCGATFSLPELGRTYALDGADPRTLGAVARDHGGGTDHEAEQRGPEQREPRAGIDRPGGAAYERQQALTLFVAAEIIGVLAAAWAIYARSWLRNSPWTSDTAKARRGARASNNRPCSSCQAR
jgi:hypothetical protein